MVNFLCQFDWTTGQADTWSDILSVFVKMFLDKINIFIVDWVEHIDLPIVDWPHLVSWRPVQKKKKKSWASLESKRFFSLTAFELGCQLFFLPSDLDWNIGSSWGSSGFWIGTIPSALLGLWFANLHCRPWDLPSSILAWVNSL